LLTAHKQGEAVQEQPEGLRHRAVPAPVGANVDGRIRVLVLASIRLYREGIADALRRDPRIDVVGLVSSSDDAVAIVGAQRPTVAVLDVGGADGLDLVRELRLLAPRLRIVVLAITEVDRDVLAWAEAGISGYVTRDGSLDDLLSAVTAAAHGEASCAPRISAALLERVHALAMGHHASSALATLTVREREIAELLEARLSNKQIAAQLHIEVTTVKNHVHNILSKLQVTRRADAAAELHRARIGAT
jgi:DNA-binding NarL/FixJ family response regulator